MKTYKTLDELFNDAKPHQVTAQEVLNGRTSLGEKGWTEIKITDKLREQVISQIVENAGGREKTKIRMYSVMRSSRPQHWAIGRFLLSRYRQVNNGKAYFSYCSGQDQVWEMKALREFLK